MIIIMKWYLADKELWYLNVKLYTFYLTSAHDNVPRWWRGTIPTESGYLTLGKMKSCLCNSPASSKPAAQISQLSTGRSWSLNWPVELSDLCSLRPSAGWVELSKVTGVRILLAMVFQQASETQNSSVSRDCKRDSYRALMIFVQPEHSYCF